MFTISHILPQSAKISLIKSIPYQLRSSNSFLADLFIRFSTHRDLSHPIYQTPNWDSGPEVWGVTIGD